MFILKNNIWHVFYFPLYQVVPIIIISLFKLPAKGVFKTLYVPWISFVFSRINTSLLILLLSYRWHLHYLDQKSDSNSHYIFLGLLIALYVSKDSITTFICFSLQTFCKGFENRNADIVFMILDLVLTLMDTSSRVH